MIFLLHNPIRFCLPAAKSSFESGSCDTSHFSDWIENRVLGYANSVDAPLQAHFLLWDGV